MLLSYINYQDNIISIINIMFIKTYDVDNNNLNEFNNSMAEGLGMVAYTADWCGHCKSLKPHWNKFQNKCSRKKTTRPITVANCDVPKYAGNAFYADKVQGFPTILAFKDGKMIESFTPKDGNRENPKDLERFLKRFVTTMDLNRRNKKRKKSTKRKTKGKKKSKKKKHKKKSKKKKKRSQRRSKRKNKKIKKKITKLIRKLGY